MTITEEVKFRRLSKINRDLFNSQPTMYKKNITDAKAGDKVIFRGGFFRLKDIFKRTKSSSSFKTGETYEVRTDYWEKGYDNSYDTDKNLIPGRITVVLDSAGSKANGWAAAYFELI